MSWARLDDGFADHPKAVRAGNSAIGCWVRCLTFCAKYATGGFVDAVVAARYGTAEDLAALVSCGLWEAVSRGESVTITGRRDSGRRALPDVEITFDADGYFIRDYLHYHLTRDEVDAGGRDSRTLARASVQQLCSKRAADARAPARADVQQNVHKCAPTTEERPDCTLERADARAGARADVQHLLHHLPSHPIPSQPTPTHPAPAPRAQARDSAREGVVAPQPDPELTADEREVTARLSDLGWRSKTRQFSGPAKWQSMASRMVREFGLTLPDLDELMAEAKEKTRGDPMDLVGDWVSPDHARWKDVLLDRRSRAKHAEAMRRGRSAQSVLNGDHHRNGSSDPKPLRDIGPIYGER